MKIENTSLQMSSKHLAESRYSRTEKLDLWVDQPATASAAKQIEEVVNLTNQSKELARSASMVPSPDDIIEGDPRLLVIKKMIEALTGRKVEVSRISIKDPDVGTFTQPSTADGAGPTDAPPAREGWGARYEASESYRETEETVVSAQGTVNTADGRTISFNLDLRMNREFAQENHMTMRAGDALKDPLVINWGGAAAKLSGQKIEFDLNSDGNNEMLAGLAGGSGYLVFDRNADGTVNNGSELFGPSTGQGFSELAALDGDGNGWIDDGDAAFGKLSVWVGGETLTSLKEANVGAILTSAMDSPFDLKDSGNALLARIQQTGIFLTEQGAAGSIQRVDLAA